MKHRSARRGLVRAALPLLVALVAGLFARNAEAYPWMIRHQYTGCIVCHADPSGGGVLTEYGRAQGDLLLRTHFGHQTEEEAMEPSSTSGFLWGLVTPPEWLLAGGSVRNLFLVTKGEGSPADTRFVQMQADLRAVVRASFVRAGGSIGYVHEGGLAAAVTHNQEDNLVSREHWVGAAFGDDAWLVRAGRLNLPYGIRSIEHTLAVRKTTRTDINTGQQHGVAVSYGGESVRGEVLAILGNYQIRPDDYRERGYSLFAEWTPAPSYAVGLSSLVTTALLDVRDGTTMLRQAHGAFVRGAPWAPLVFMAEGNALFRSPAGASMIAGYSGMLQADYEPTQGLHLIGTGEIANDGLLGSTPMVGGWVSAQWFFAAHLDARVDGIVQSVPQPVGSASLITLLAQIHAYL
jgi:hypothetical protein